MLMVASGFCMPAALASASRPYMTTLTFARWASSMDARQALLSIVFRMMTSLPLEIMSRTLALSRAMSRSEDTVVNSTAYPAFFPASVTAILR